MEVCVARASAAIVQRVPPAAVDWFNEWQRGVTENERDVRPAISEGGEHVELLRCRAQLDRETERFRDLQAGRASIDIQTLRPIHVSHRSTAFARRPMAT